MLSVIPEDKGDYCVGTQTGYYEHKRGRGSCCIFGCVDEDEGFPAPLLGCNWAISKLTGQ